MALILVVKEGERPGTRYKITSGVRIGRKEGEIILRDHKVSKMHARFDKDDAGRLVLIDNNSSNGIKVDGKRVRYLRIQPGQVFAIGQTVFEVLETEDPSASTLLPTIPTVGSPSDWHSVLTSLCEELAHSNKNDSIENLRPFPHPVRLKVTAGLQLGAEWLMAYGPRWVGANSIEHPILDPEAPAECFRIDIEGDKLVFITQQSGYVSLNHTNIQRAELKNGDIIRCGNTQLKVEVLHA